MKSLNLGKIKAALERVPNEFEGLVAQVGFPSGKNYPDGTSVAYVAAIQEFGAPAVGIPPRPFMQPTVAAEKDKWTKEIAAGAVLVAAGKATAFDILDAVGFQAANDMKAKIATIFEPPLAEATLAARRRRGNSSTKPLNDTGTMLAWLQHSVAPEGSEFTSGNK
jgi:hypothetical protein